MNLLHQRKNSKSCSFITLVLLLLGSSWLVLYQQQHVQAFQSSLSSRRNNGQPGRVTTAFHHPMKYHNNNIFNLKSSFDDASSGDFPEIEGHISSSSSSFTTTTTTNSSSSSSGGSNNNNNNKSLLQNLDDVGQSFKPRAIKASAMAMESANNQTTTKLKFLAKSYLYYTLFMIYRAYRGFFVILPAVYREVYRKPWSNRPKPSWPI
jgi:hypothetical protein